MEGDHAAVVDVLRRHLADPTTGWALGGFGALAEFHRDADEPAAMDGDGLGLTTARGAVRINPQPGLALLAYEGLAKDGRHWSHGLIATLPTAAARRSGRTVLTEVGPGATGGGVLFDLGVGLANVDACVRVDSAPLVETLRSVVGQPLFCPEADAARIALIEAAPDRVFLSAAGRIEVRGPIPAPGETSPSGPHTHLLPRLLAQRRTHAATVPVPRGRLPVIALFPPNPARDGEGTPRPFDPAAHAAFQTLMDRFAAPEVRRAKAAVRAAVAAGDLPPASRPTLSKVARTAMRVAVRQLAFEQEENPALAAWRAWLEPAHARPSDHGSLATAQRFP